MELSMSKPRMRKDRWAGNGFVCISEHARAAPVISRSYRIIGTGDTMEQAFQNWKVKQK